MTSVAEALAFVAQALAVKESSLVRRQAEEILCCALACDRSFLYSHSCQQLSEGEWLCCQDYLSRRLRGEPLAYIHGVVEFYHCQIKVTPAVLIPRQETEILVDKIAKTLARQDLHGKVLLDLCCGSGCIGIALKKQFPDLSVVLADFSFEALQVARQNALDNQVDVTCLQGDFLEPFKGERAHYVVCNPPYISEAEFNELGLEVKEFEPKMALLGGGSGLEFYERLASDLPACLFPNAQVWLEIGYLQGEGVQKLFQGVPWKGQYLENDWAGHHRFFFLENE